MQEKSRSLSDSDRPVSSSPAASNEKESGSEENKSETTGRKTSPSAIASSVAAEEATAPIPMAAVEPRAEKSVPPAVIVVGDYVLPDDFDRARARLEALGLAYRVERKKLPTPMYRVYLGPFPHRDQARKMLARSREMGDDPFLDKGPHGYQVIISSFYLQANVAAWQKKYRAVGLELKVLKEPLPIEHKILVVETAGLKEDPQTLLARLQTAGFAKARLRPLPPSNPQKM
ncbi:MAG: SPOR domain-containing protein [Deltaproteobacteria bacterium]|nr:SPOR domain-containing protein [Deltaproteobacteria bacterium]